MYCTTVRPWERASMQGRKVEHVESVSSKMSISRCVRTREYVVCKQVKFVYIMKVIEFRNK